MACLGTARLLTSCLSTCTVTASFTHSVVVPLLKNSRLDPSCLDNYRPISITTCDSKLLEIFILDELKSPVIPHDLQFGLISNRDMGEAVLLLSLACFVFEISGGRLSAPPVGTKVA